MSSCLNRSIKGLSATIAEIEGGEHPKMQEGGEEESEEETDGRETGGEGGRGGERGGEGGEGWGLEESIDLFAQFDDIEAEIESALKSTLLEEGEEGEGEGVEGEEWGEGDEEGEDEGGGSGTLAASSGTILIPSLIEKGGVGGGVSEGSTLYHKGAEEQRARLAPLPARVAVNEFEPPARGSR